MQKVNQHSPYLIKVIQITLNSPVFKFHMIGFRRHQFGYRALLD